MESIGIGLIGLGAIGLGAHLPAILRSDRARLVAVADISARRRELVRALVPDAVAVVDGVQQVLENPEIGAVVLATPPWVAPGLAVEAASTGRATLVEKPVATTVAAAEAYSALTPAERARIQVGLTYRHDPALRYLRDLLHEDALGSPLLIRAHIYDERRDAADLAHTRLIESTLGHGSPVIHEGSHVFDWLSYLVGAPGRVEDAWTLATRDGLAAPNVTGARLTYPGGALALVEFGWLTDVLPRCEISVLGDAGYAVLDGRSFALTITDATGTRQPTFAGDRMTRCFDRQFDRFIDLATGLTGHAEPSLHDGLAALATSETVTSMAVRMMEAIR